jgi:hypothetical protein
MRLGEQQIEVPPPPARGSLDQLNIFGAENHRAKDSQEFGHPPDRAAIDREIPFHRRPIQFDLMITGMVCPGADKKSILSMADHLRACHSAKGPQSCQEVNRFQDVGLSLGIVSEQKVKARRELDIEPAVISKISQPESAQMHVAAFKSCTRLTRAQMTIHDSSPAFSACRRYRISSPRA